VGKVIDRLERQGFKIVAMKMIRMDSRMAGEFYREHMGKAFYESLVEFMSSGNCIPMVLEKENAVEDLRALMGATDPEEAQPGTIRRDFAESKQNNIIHGADSIEKAEREIRFFFPEMELVQNMD